MKSFICLSAIAFTVCTPLISKGAEISFTGNQEKIIGIVPDRNTGLDMLFVAFDTSQLSQMRISGISGNVEVSRYSNLGGGFAEPVQVSYDGDTAILPNPEGDMGYIITDSQGSYYMWLVNYLPHKLTLTSVSGADSQECENTRLNVTGSGEAIHYYTIDGRPVELSREIHVEYDNLEWDEEAENYTQKSEAKILDHLSNPVILTPPLYVNSTVSVSGDRFLNEWGRGVTVESPLIYANGLNAHTTAVQTNLPDDDDETPSNIVKTETQGMGGSAPVDIEFRAYTTDAVIHNEWQIASDEQFEYINNRFNEQNLDYTFNEEGTYYIRFVGSNSDGTCETIRETYTVGVGSSELRIPNAFTPNDDGVNDEWKVGYRSLISFKCTIFDRYGNDIISFNDPSKGWDGKYKGKKVKPGVYFYVIEAKGADGKNYKKGGDINLIISKRSTTTSGGTTE